KMRIRRFRGRDNYLETAGGSGSQQLMLPPQRAALPSRRLPAVGALSGITVVPSLMTSRLLPGDPALTSTCDESLWPVDALFTSTCCSFADPLYPQGGIFIWDGASAIGFAAPVSANAGAANATSGAAVMAAPAMMPAATFLMFVMISTPFCN